MRTVELGQVTTIDRVGVDPSALLPETLYLGLEHIERGGRIVGHDTVAGADVASTKFRFSPEHVLFGKLRPNLGKVSRPDFSGVCSTDILPVRPSKGLDRDYLAHYLAQPSMVAFAASRTSGANLPRLSPAVLAKFPIPLPPLDEQRRIAAILDHADALRAKRRQVLTHLDTLTQSIFNDLFGDLVGTTVRPLAELVTSLEGGKSLVAADSSSETSNRVLKISAVTSNHFRATESKPLPDEYTPPAAHFVRRGDLLFSRANTTELVGAVALVESDVSGLVLPDKLWRFVWRQPEPVDPVFMWKLLQTPSMRRELSARSSGTGGSMKNISKAKLMTLPVPIPPLAAQRDFARYVKGVNAQRSAMEHARSVDDELFSSLQSLAFRGEL